MINVDKSNEKEKMEFFDTKNLLKDNNDDKDDEGKNKIGIGNKIILINKDKEDEKENQEKENININTNKESMSEINISNNIESSQKKTNNKMKLNILKNMPPKDLKDQLVYNTGGEDQKLKLDFQFKELNNNKIKNDFNPNMNNMNINFNDLNIRNFNQKYNNFIDNNEPNLKNGNGYSIYLKNKGNKKSRSSNKNNINNNINNMIPFFDYNQPNNNIITNFMLNHNNNQKLFVKFNKDIQRGRGDNNIINNNNQFIQNNNFININYYPQPNESKLIYIYNIIILLL